MVGASGFSYEDAAAICGCAVGTIKSRVNRARSKLSALLYVDGAEDFGPDETVRAVIGGSGGGFAQTDTFVIPGRSEGPDPESRLYLHREILGCSDVQLQIVAHASRAPE